MSSSNKRHVIFPNVYSPASYPSNLYFRCLACCTSSPSLFLTYPEVQDHFPPAHRTSLVTEAVLLPASLESLQCRLCTSQALLTEATFRAHLRTHSSFFDKEEKWRGRCQRLCRICGEDIWERIEEHLELKHPRVTFACEGDLEEMSAETEEKTASEPAFLAIISSESLKKEMSVPPKEMSSPINLTELSQKKFSVKVEQLDDPYVQPCQTESCSLKTENPSPVAVLHRQTVVASHSGTSSLPEDFQGQLLPLPCLPLPPASPALVYWCTVCPSLCTLPLTSLHSLAIHRGSTIHRAAYREAFLEAGCRHLPDWETSHTSLLATSIPPTPIPCTYLPPTSFPPTYLPPTSCSHCSLDCSNRWLLLRHRRSAHPKQVPWAAREPYCYSCRLPLLTSWREHSQEASHQLHLTDTQPCTFCPARLEKTVPQAHYEQKHPEEMFCCILGSCNSSFNLFLTVKELGRHQEQQHSADSSLHRSSSYLLPKTLLYINCDQYRCFATFCTTDSAPLLMHIKDAHKDKDYGNIMYFCRVCNRSNNRLVKAEEHAERHRGSNIYQNVDVKHILKKNKPEKKMLSKEMETKCRDRALAGGNKKYVKQKLKDKKRRFCVQSSHHQSLLKLEEEFKDIAGFENVESHIDLKEKVAGIVVTFKTPKIATFALKCVHNLRRKDSSLVYRWRS